MVEAIRFSGLASGMDTQSIIDSLMKAERLPLNKINQNKQLLEWKRDDYRSMNLLLSELDTIVFDGIFKKSKMVQRSVTSSNTEFVTATASADAANVSYKIDNVKLATAARKQTTLTAADGSDVGVSGSIEKIDPDKSLWSQKEKFLNNSEFDWNSETVKQEITVPKNEDGKTPTREFELNKFAVKEHSLTEDSILTIGGESFKIITSSDSTLEADEVYIDVTNGKMKVGKDLPAGQKLEVSYTSHHLEFDVKTFNEDGEPQYENFKFDGSTTLNNMFSKINKSQAGINLFYDSGSDKVVAMRNVTGEFNPDASGNEIEFVNVTRDAEGKVIEGNPDPQNTFFTNVLGLGADIEGTGTDAEFSINGLETKRKSNVFTLNGVTFTLKKDSKQADGTDSKESATINIQTDTDAIVKTITEFVDKYNEIIGKINDKISEEKFSSYKPLTSEEKEALSEDEIEKWEEKAKSGMLRRDSILSGTLDKMRSTLYGQMVSNDVTLTGDYTHLTTIGITTTNNYMDRGKLEINEEKLRAAIADNPDSVYQLFMADGEGEGEKGIARRLRDTIGSTIDSIEERAGNSYKTAHSYTMGKQLLDFEDQIKRFEDRLAQTEDRYWKQYNAMEKAIQQLNNQSSTLMSYLGTGTQG